MKFLDQITKTRDQIQGLKTEHVRLVAQPRSRQQVTEFVRDGVRDIETSAASETALMLERLAAGQPAELLTVNASAMTPQGPVSVSINLLPVMVRLLGGAAVRKALLLGAEDIPEGMAPAAREKRLTAISGELDDLQLQEEHLIREAALDGQDIPHRFDADPAYVLALETCK